MLREEVLREWTNYRARFQQKHQSLVRQKERLSQDLDKEKSWWDKWKNDQRTQLTSDMDDSQELPTLIANQLGSTSKKTFAIQFEFGYDQLIYLKYSGEIEKGKKIVKIISEYYKEGLDKK